MTILTRFGVCVERRLDQPITSRCMLVMVRNELMSEFAMELNASASTVDVRFTREASRPIDMSFEHDNLRKSLRARCQMNEPYHRGRSGWS